MVVETPVPPGSFRSDESSAPKRQPLAMIRLQCTEGSSVRRRNLVNLNAERLFNRRNMQTRKFLHGRWRPRHRLWASCSGWRAFSFWDAYKTPPTRPPRQEMIPQPGHRSQNNFMPIPTDLIEIWFGPPHDFNLPEDQCFRRANRRSG